MHLHPPTLPLRGIALALVGVTLGAASPSATLLPGASPVKSAAGRVVVVERPEEQVYLVTVRLEQATLSDAFPVYPIPGGVLIPLGELARLVQFAIDVNPKEGMASGWFIDPKRTFAFDALLGTVKHGGKDFPVNPQRYEVQTQDIFVDAGLLAEWFPLSLDVDLRQSSIVIRPKEMLPIQAQWKRGGQPHPDLASLGTSLEAERKTYVPMEDPYRWADIPSIDQTLGVGRTSRGEHGTTAQSTTLTSGDLLGMEHQAYLGLTNFGEKKRSFRLSLGRRDPGAGLLGPMHATQFLLGEVTTQGMELISGGAGGTGFMVSNHPIAQDFQFDRRSFRGILPPGWQVELYHNTSLLAIQTVSPEGVYEFLDVPVSFGPNEYKLVFYGPQGQRRQEVYRSDVNPLQVPKGDFRYRLSGLEASDSRKNGSAEAEYGLTSNLTLGFTGSSTTLPGGGSASDGPRHQYTGLLLRSNLNFLASQVSMARMETGAMASLLQLQTGLGDTTFNLRHAQLQEGFESPSYRGAGGGLKSRTDFTTDFRTSPFKALNAMFVGFGVRREATFNGQVAEGLTNRLSTAFLAFNVSNELNWQRTISGHEVGASNVRGALSVSRLMRSFAMRGSASYTLGSDKHIDHFSLGVDKQLPDQSSLSLALTRDIASGRTAAQASYQRLTGTVGLGANLSYSQSSGWQAGLFLRTTFTRDAARRRWNMSTTSNAAAGSVSATAFVDLNGNGRRDPDEPIKSGVGFLVNGFSRPNKTDGTGSALIPDLPGGNYAYVKVDNPSMEDPLWRGTHPGYRFVSRGGHTTHVELPVAAFSELDGTIYLKVNGRRQETSGLLVELVDKDGKVVRQIRSAFDGYFTFQNLPQGTYTLRIHPGDAERRGFKPLKTRTLELLPTGSQLDAQDLEVEQLPAPSKKEPVDLTGQRSALTPTDTKAAPTPVLASLPPSTRKQIAPVPSRALATATAAPIKSTSSLAPLSNRNPRSRAIQAGQLERAVRLSQKQVHDFAPSAWLVRVKLARRTETLQKTAALVGEENLLLLPYAHASGTPWYQLLVGGYATRQQAQAAAKAFPEALLRRGAQPVLVPASSLQPKRSAAAIQRSKRLVALQAGLVDRAVALSQAQVEQLAPSSWMVRVRMARRKETLRQSARLLPNENLFVLPCEGASDHRWMQLLMGPFETKISAQSALKALPDAFTTKANRPFLVASATLKRPTRAVTAQGAP